MEEKDRICESKSSDIALSVLHYAKNCPVCLEEFNNTHVNFCSTRCGHVFHTTCLIKSLKTTDGKCPVCRNRLILSEEVLPSRQRRRPEWDEVPQERLFLIQRFCYACSAFLLLVMVFIVCVALKLIIL